MIRKKNPIKLIFYSYRKIRKLLYNFLDLITGEEFYI